MRRIASAAAQAMPRSPVVPASQLDRGLADQHLASRSQAPVERRALAFRVPLRKVARVEEQSG